MTFLEWICLRRNLDYAKAWWLGPIVAVAFILIAIAVVVGAFATLFHFLAETLRVDANHEAIRNIGLILVAVFGAPFVVWRAIVAQKQADTAEQSHVTDQINKAVAGLGAEKVVNKIGRPVKIVMGNSDEERTEIEWQGSQLAIGDEEFVGEEGDWSVFSESVPNIEVRVGAIYGLERIAQDSTRDHIQIMEILTSYIRENAPVVDLEPSEGPFVARPRSDVQAALDVIGRRAPKSIELEHSAEYRLDLHAVDLSGANFLRGNFEGALLFDSRLEASSFRSTNLRAARLQRCLLNYADFYRANLLGAIIDGARISSVAAMRGSITRAADMRGLSMADSDLSGINHLPTKETHCPTFGTKGTTLGVGLMIECNKRNEDMEAFLNALEGIDVDDEIGVRERLTQAGLLYWSPFDAYDGASYVLRDHLWNHLGLKGFPYDDR